MLNIISISELKEKIYEIFNLCNIENKTVFITKDDIVDLVIMSIENYENQKTLLKLYSELFETELEVQNGNKGEDFIEVAEKLRNKVIGRI